ncbi:BatD family protein [Lignipirellula cremea]|uniref:Tetratricopeptide repeat protein n=1 Tax=Lignipirellula cremea TaxID=2528010 RepID=A0A518E4V1_9BACT|nr:BatD family protein [Lignipirellula cremea]QDU99104.1 Tetratricopeptide repeat protein [Lignipirellula cremea]
MKLFSPLSSLRSALPCTLVLIALAMGPASLARAAEVNAAISSREAYVGAPVTLQVEIANASDFDEPTVPDIDGLEIRSAGSPRRSSQTTIINGRRTDRTSAVYVWQVIPRREGTFEIPALQLQVDGRTETTDPLRFVVAKSETGDLLFVEVTGQQEKIYVGQPLTLTLNVWIKPYRDAKHSLTLTEANMWQLLSDGTRWGAFSDRMQELARNNQRPGGQEVLRPDANGEEHAYYRYQVEATVYPKRPGQIDVGDVQVVVNYPTRLEAARDPFGAMFDDDFFPGGSPFPGGFGRSRRNTLTVSATRPAVAEASVEPIEVTPIPTADRPFDYRGAVGEYQIATQAAPTSVKAGDPITLHIGVSGDGPMELVAAPPLADLPNLTADFQVSREPLAGLVQDNVKLFTTSIRPRREGITQIPAIPLSYFDPVAEKFVTVHSEPITIEVAPADRLALGAIVGGNQDAGSPDKDDADTPASLDLSSYLGADAAHSSTSPAGWPWLWALLLPPLVVVAVGLFLHRQRWLPLFVGGAKQRLRSGLKAIEAAASPSAVASVVRDFSEGMDGAKKDGKIAALLNACEQAAYAGASDVQLDELKAKATALLPELAASRSQQTTGQTHAPRNVRRQAAFACLALAGLAVAVPAGTMLAGWLPEQQEPTVSSPAPAATNVLPGLTDTQREAILAEANAASQRGQQAMASDAAAMKEAFSTAALKYQLLVDAGVQNSRLYGNLANACLQSGELGRAIASYERALQLDPSNHQARVNLHAARQAVVSPGEPAAASFSWTGLAAGLNRYLPPTSRWLLLATAWMLAWGVVLLRLFWSGHSWKYAMLPAAALLLIAVALVGTDRWLGDTNHQAIVVAKAVVLHQFPLENAPAVTGQPLPEGEAVAVLDQRDAWLEIRTPSGQTGWVKSPQVTQLGGRSTDA